MENVENAWVVKLAGQAVKQAKKLPEPIKDRLYALVIDLRGKGPVQPDWPHYGKLRNRRRPEYHCHLNKGKPCYVAVWQCTDNDVRLIEVRYVGTHENAPY